MTRDDGYDDFLDAVEAGEPFYLQSDDGTTYLPPMSADPVTGDELHTRSLPQTGEILTYTRTSVASPEFADDAPYLTAIADFGPVSLTGQVQTDADELDIGQTVTLGVEHRETDDARVLVFYLTA